MKSQQLIENSESHDLFPADVIPVSHEVSTTNVIEIMQGAITGLAAFRNNVTVAIMQIKAI